MSKTADVLLLDIVVKDLEDLFIVKVEEGIDLFNRDCALLTAEKEMNGAEGEKIVEIVSRDALHVVGVVRDVKRHHSTKEDVHSFDVCKQSKFLVVGLFDVNLGEYILAEVAASEFFLFLHLAAQQCQSDERFRVLLFDRALKSQLEGSSN